MRTIKQWFELVEDEGLRAELLEALQDDFATKERDSFVLAVAGGFLWNKSNKGVDYWLSVILNPPQLLPHA